jgi:aromatic ring-opening dioxygenase catalytic subunit (LigB family)
MLLINPDADIPIVQVSVLSSEDPAAHISMGRALSKLRDSNVAIIGSGFASFHNLRLLFSGALGTSEFKAKNDAWSEAVTESVCTKELKERGKKFDGWRKWPASFEMHPDRGGEHFLPLVVSAGAGGDEVAEYYKDSFQGLDMYSYYWT